MCINVLVFFLEAQCYAAVNIGNPQRGFPPLPVIQTSSGLIYGIQLAFLANTPPPFSHLAILTDNNSQIFFYCYFSPFN